MSEEERILIGDLLAAGHTQRSVAVELGRRAPRRSAGKSAATPAAPGSTGRSARTANPTWWSGAGWMERAAYRRMLHIADRHAFITAAPPA